MRGAERPGGGMRWTRPFLPPLEPLSHDAACQTFADITDVRHDDADIQELLGFTDNVPLAVNLVANIAAFEGYDTIVSRWKEEKTTLFSEGSDKRSNLDLFESPLLSLLPDGISETDLLQSDLPITTIGRSKTTLVRTSLVYLDHDKRVRVFVPIREYIRARSPPPPSLCRPLRSHFHRLIMLWHDYQHLSTTGIAQRIAANVGNFHAVLAHGLDSGEPDLTETVYSILTFDSFYRMSRGRSSGMLELLPDYLEHLVDHRLQGAYLGKLVTTWQYRPLSDSEQLEKTAIEHFKAAGDMAGEANFLCGLGTYFRQHDNDIPKALRYYERAVNLAKEVNDIKTQCVAIREAALSMRRLAQIHGLFYHEAQAIRVELLCRVSLGNLASCVTLSAQGRALLAFCGLQGSTLDLALVNSDAEVHLQKTEYAEARALYSRTYVDQAPMAHAYDRLNLVDIDNEIGVDTVKVCQDLEAVKSTFESIMNPPGITLREVFEAYVDIRDGLLTKARLSLEKSFAATRGNDQEISILCLNKLGNLSCGLAATWTTFGWTLVLMGFALKGNNTIAIYHALRCMGDVFLAGDDDDTALSLFHVALEGFTATDIHRSRGECALRLGDIFHVRGNKEDVFNLWNTARQCFVRSLQTRDIIRVDERIRAHSQ
ncbi:hypothetical protein DFH08DRAFT_950949 [Mycena albidolilacea]|uniref:Uncharacterized protein n=1 Tax=Mycena albidolilacea TaxID=1033008 RepID=A0AAD7F2R2_9AGAR|nr:hypothetical protein DFH08DRAFT_950949 [Mycena albidolilacea]